MLDIVLVEDDARLGTMVSDYLQRHGYQVAHERSGERAVARILADKPALVLLDVGLPDQMVSKCVGRSGPTMTASSAC